MADFPNDIERVDSGSGTVSVSESGLMSRTVQVKWLVHSISGYTAAEEKGRKLAPLYYDGHRRESLDCRPAGGGWYEIAASYGNAGVDAYEGWGIETDDGATLIPSGLSVDTTGNTEHITQAWSNTDDPEEFVKKYPTDETHPNYSGAINVSGDRVNGVDITVPTFNFTETWLVPAWYLLRGRKHEQEPAKDEELDSGASEPYAVVLHDMTGKVNEDEWRIFKPGEVLFLGARYDASRGQTMVPVTFSFSARKNAPKDKLYVGDIKIDEKEGWDYLWIVYESDSNEGTIVKRPAYAYVDRVYERRKFEDLKIGDKWSQIYLATGDVFTHPIDKTKIPGESSSSSGA